ncbi:tetratricopeptide repeat-containing sensor histidine kinase [Abyssalbus ytuae]|uniref:Histidine kinase n=1 Tax=Abyssalbus ytuae TaxID=2926907 RepID=A0A9E7CUU2_9FLAO|nr:histidine kinase [Abyssalbus ytuae]UOB18957.1 histidine kinase [Abyssalbus ytuae]
MKKYFTLILFILLFHTGYSQSIQQEKSFIVKGSVKTYETREPIDNVRVYVVGGRATETDIFGEFSLQVKTGDIIFFESPNIETIKYTIKSDEDIDVLVKGYEREQSSKKISRRSITSLKHQNYLDSADFYKKTDIEKSLTFIEKSLSVLSGKSENEKTAQSFSKLGDIYLYYKQYDLAISNYKSSLNAGYTTETDINLGKAYVLNQEYENAQKVFSELLKQNQLTVYNSILIYEGLGDAYKGLNNNTGAINNYKKALKIARDNLVTPKITDLNSKIAGVYSEQKNITQAEQFYQNSLSLAKKENPKRAVQEKEKVADFYNQNKLYDKEIELRQSNLEEVELMEEAVQSPVPVSTEAQDSITSQKINYKIANAYIMQQEFDKAIPYLERSIAEADNREDLVVQKDATRKLSEVYKNVGDYTKALETYQEYVQLVDQLYIKKEQEISQASRFSRDITLKQNRISSLEKDRELSQSKYDLAVKDQQLVAESNKRQKLIIYALIFGMFMMALTIYLFYRNSRQQKLANNLLALKSLRTQMNPHFIFNALNSVNNFIAQSDERSANRYLTEFSTLMRAVLENSEEDFIPLSKEIELLELYTKLEHSRFKEKFDYEIKIDENVKVEDFQIPPMLVQPYVENAIWHGLRYKESKGHLKIQLTQPDSETIKITIEDDGIGRRKSTELKTLNQRKQKSKGMGNIKKRIRILNDMYKDKVDVFIEDVLKDSTGTRVILTLKKD